MAIDISKREIQETALRTVGCELHYADLMRSGCGEDVKPQRSSTQTSPWPLHFCSSSTQHCLWGFKAITPIHSCAPLSWWTHTVELRRLYCMAHTLQSVLRSTCKSWKVGNEWKRERGFSWAGICDSNAVTQDRVILLMAAVAKVTYCLVNVRVSDKHPTQKPGNAGLSLSLQPCSMQGTLPLLGYIFK